MILSSKKIETDSLQSLSALQGLLLSLYHILVVFVTFGCLILLASGKCLWFFVGFVWFLALLGIYRHIFEGFFDAWSSRDSWSRIWKDRAKLKKWGQKVARKCWSVYLWTLNQVRMAALCPLSAHHFLEKSPLCYLFHFAIRAHPQWAFGCKATWKVKLWRTWLRKKKLER